MIKKILLIALLNILIFVPTVYSQSNTSGNDESTSVITPETPKRPASKISPIPTRAKTNEMLLEKREGNNKEVKDDLKENRQKRLNNNFQMIRRRLQAAVTRFEKISQRIKTRLEKLGSRGVDVSSFTQELTQIQSDLEAIKTKIDSLDSLFDTMTTSDDPKQTFTSLKGEIEDIKKQLQNVHLNFQEIMTGIKKVTPASDANRQITATP